jgi:hypothetical protein
MEEGGEEPAIEDESATDDPEDDDTSGIVSRLFGNLLG